MARAQSRSISLEEAVREFHARTEMATRLSHEFRTPLTSIIGYAEALLCCPDLSLDKRNEFAALIKAEGEKLAKLVNLIVERSIQENHSSSNPDYFK